MSTTLAELAQLVGGEVRGDASVRVKDAATQSVAEAGDITLADTADRTARLETSAATAAIVPRTVECESMPTIVVDDVRTAFAQVVQHFRPLPKVQSCGVSPAAIVDPTAMIAADVDIHAGANIGAHAIIGAGSVVHAGVCVLPGCVIGERVTLFPRVVLYEGTQVGDGSVIHSGAVLGAYGFGYTPSGEGHMLCAQLGHVEIGRNVEIGACSTVDRGSYGATVIGEGTKIDNLVQIGHNCRLGKHNLICSQVGIAGSTTTGDNVVMAGQVGVRDHVHIGTGAVLSAKSGISNHVADGAVMMGRPATPVRQQRLKLAAVAKLPEMRKQFRTLQRQFAALLADMQSTDESDQDQAA